MIASAPREVQEHGGVLVVVVPPQARLVHLYGAVVVLLRQAHVRHVERHVRHRQQPVRSRDAVLSMCREVAIRLLLQDRGHVECTRGRTSIVGLKCKFRAASPW